MGTRDGYRFCRGGLYEKEIFKNRNYCQLRVSCHLFCVFHFGLEWHNREEYDAYLKKDTYRIPSDR